ncbi:hypothetical protein CEXT_209211 [Caerostris extrusa]|uniref:Uncharacterized protein n=1 Tax=Caerostris extrusa TaxID=172846 RepID=A0AAV4P3F5_CAEEX|nr:hypothetical protein CEXT_209211 [Caerostris extrusa]
MELSCEKKADETLKSQARKIVHNVRVLLCLEEAAAKSLSIALMKRASQATGMSVLDKTDFDDTWKAPSKPAYRNCEIDDYDKPSKTFISNKGIDSQITI